MTTIEPKVFYVTKVLYETKRIVADSIEDSLALYDTEQVFKVMYEI